MADFEAPSFSLGFDLDLDSDPQSPAGEPPPPARPSHSAALPGELEGDDNNVDFPAEVMDSDSDPNLGPGLPGKAAPVPVLRRLRRGTAHTERPGSMRSQQTLEDDDIEDFSSQEDRCRDNCLSTQYNSVGNSSKISLHGHGVLTAIHSKVKERKQLPSVTASTSLEKRSNKIEFPKLTVSPLRRFQLLSDSDSDDSSVSDLTRVPDKIHKSLNERQFGTGQFATTSEQKKNKESTCLGQMKVDFCPLKISSIPTPALDEVCEEYFTAVKDKHSVQKPQSVGIIMDTGHHQIRNICKSLEQQWDFDSVPPAHRYYFHEDPRIQELIRNRLPNFYPLGVFSNKGNREPDAAAINYMSQFGQAEGSMWRAVSEVSRPQAIGQVNKKRQLTKGRKKPKVSSAADVSGASGSWVNPKSSASTPQNASKRRVHAEFHSAGHWYTAGDGRRVYVTKNGREMTGQAAYRFYKKENGPGFRKSRKKITAKRK